MHIHTHMHMHMHTHTHMLNTETYAELRDWSVDHYDQFWGKFFHYSDIKYSKPYDEVRTLNQCNTCMYMYSGTSSTCS